MTIRSVILGLLAGAVIAAGAFINDYVFKLTPLIGSHLPVSVFGGLIVFAVTVNPLLGLISRRLQLKPFEMAVALAITFASCGIPSSGFYRVFGSAMIHPVNWDEETPSFRKVNILQYAPRHLMPNDGVFDDAIHGTFVRGLGRPGHPISLSQVPWDSWSKALPFWLGLVAVFTLGLIALTFVLHEQWSRRERMPYPIAEVAATLIETPVGGRVPAIFRSKAFWYGAGIIAAIHVINIINVYVDGKSISIPLEANFEPFRLKLDWLAKGWPWGLWRILHPRLYFTPVAFAFFMRTDAALSLGIARPVWMLLTAGLYWYGMDLTTSTTYFGGFYAFVNFGAYTAMACLLLYTGRHYFFGVLRRALFVPTGGKVPKHSVWSLRVFIVCMITGTYMLSKTGMDWPFAAMVLLGFMLSYVIIARINVETGMFYILGGWIVPPILWGIFGPKALGPRILLTVGIPMVLFGRVARENIMPFIANGLRVFERVSRGSKSSLAEPSRIVGLSGWLVVAMLLSLIVALPCVMWAHYNFGSKDYQPNTDAGQFRALMSGTVRDINRMINTGDLKESVNYSTWERITNANPSYILRWAFVGAGFVLVCGVLRLRYTWWPLHPVLFLLWTTPSTSELGASFLLGAILKGAVVKLYGARMVQKLRPLLIGVVAGDLIGGLVSTLAGGGYYLVNGFTKVGQYYVFPI